MSDDLVKRLQANGDVLRHIEAQAARIKELEKAVIQSRSLTKLMKPQADRIAELEAALQFATEYVGRLALTLAKKHYPDQQHFELHPHLLGRIDQIDNMTCGLHRASLVGGKDE